MDENSTPPQKPVKRRKPLRGRFKRTKNDERKTQKERVLQSVPCNRQQPLMTLDTLRNVHVPGWTVSETEQQDAMQFCLLKSNPPNVVRSVTVLSDMTWYAHALGKVVP